MRLAIFIISLLFGKLYAQDIVFVTKWKYEADVDIIWVDNETIADVVINPVSRRSELQLYNNSWLFTTNRSQSSLIIRIVQSGNAVRVYMRKTPKRFVSVKHKHKYQNLFKYGVNTID